MTALLDTIVEHKRGEIEAARSERPEAELQRQLADAPRPRGFVESLRAAVGVGLIAEVKRASPSAGLIREEFDPVELARLYAANGAACISCLTDEHFFQGRLADLVAIRGAVERPVLRKDFLLDRYQLLEARVAGADAVLLIAECLDEAELPELFAYAGELGLDVLLEVYEPESLNRVLELAPPLLGINNRNLQTFQTDLDHTLQLAAQVPAGTLLVSESGIRDRAEIDRLAAAGVGAVLVGETLMRADDVAAKVAELSGAVSS